MTSTSLKHLPALVLAGSAMFCATAQAALITPVSVAASTGSLNSGYVASNLINNSGLSAPLGVDSLADGVFTSNWLVGTNTAQLYFDLGSVYNLQSAYIWNYSYSRPDIGVDFLVRGVRKFNLDLSEDGITYTTALSNAELSIGVFDATPSQAFAISGDARYVRISTLSNWGAGLAAGLNEVKFAGALTEPVAVPEPASLALVGVALAGVAMQRRRARG